MKQHWLTRPETVRRLWTWGSVALAITVLAQIPVHLHAYFGVDGWFGFNATFGFLTCVAMVLFAKALGMLFKRKDSYYDD